MPRVTLGKVDAATPTRHHSINDQQQRAGQAPQEKDAKYRGTTLPDLFHLAQRNAENAQVLANQLEHIVYTLNGQITGAPNQINAGLIPPESAPGDAPEPSLITAMLDVLSRAHDNLIRIEDSIAILRNTVLPA